MASASVGKYVGTKHSNPPRPDLANHGRSTARDRIAAAARLPQKPNGVFVQGSTVSWLGPSSTNSLNAREAFSSDTQSVEPMDDDAASYDHFADSVLSDSEDTVRTNFNALDLEQQHGLSDNRMGDAHEQEMNAKQSMLITQPLVHGTSSESHKFGSAQRFSGVNPPLVVSAMQTLENLKMQKEFQNQRRHFPTFNQSQSHTSGRFSPSIQKQLTFDAINGNQSYSNLQADFSVGGHVDKPPDLPRLEQSQVIFDINDQNLVRHGQGKSLQPLARDDFSGIFNATSSRDPVSNDNEIDDSSTVRSLEERTETPPQGRSSSAEAPLPGQRASRAMQPELALSRETASEGATRKKRAAENALSSPGRVTSTEELDFDLKVLAEMKYATLRDQPFEDDQKATNLLQDEIKKDVSLEARLKSYASQSPVQQAQFFTGLSIMDWEEAGDWFIQRFGEIVKSSMEFRKERRQISRQFENEVSKREEQVRARTEHLAGEKARLLTGSQSLMQGQGVSIG